MHKNIKHTIKLLLTSALVLFSIVTNAQEVNVVDNKGTIVPVNNNTVFTQDTDPNTPTTITVDGDIWFHTDTTDPIDHTLIKIYNGTDWVELVPKAARIFYPPSIAIDASTAGNYTLDLYNDVYRAQFDTPLVRSDLGGADEAPTSIPTYQDDELYYYVTDADLNVFGDGATLTNMSITAAGVLSYTIVTPPTDDNTIINVVFVVK